MNFTTPIYINRNYIYVTVHHNRFLFTNQPDELIIQIYFFFYWRYNPLWVCVLQPSSGAIASSRKRFLDHTQRRATVGRTPLDE